MQLIGRKEEIKKLDHFSSSNSSEFMALYGRRRVEKTFMVNEYFREKDPYFLKVTGVKKGKMSEQISHFTRQLSDIFYRGIELQQKKN